MPITQEEKRQQRPVGLWPREHGAYVQLLAPMLCALAFGRANGSSLAIAGAGCCAFLAHEPLLVALGRRGPRAKELQGRAVFARLLTLVALGASLFAYVGARMPEVALSAFVPGSLGVAALLLVLAGRERTLPGELLSAATLASFTVPVLIAGGYSLRAAVSFAAGWQLVHLSATCAARAYVYRKRDRERSLRATALTLSLVALLSTALYLAGLVPLVWPLALSPFVALTVLLATHVFAPKSPKRLGWVLTAANLVAVIGFGLSLR